MQKDTPKPFLHLGECTILEKTIGRFLGLEGLQQIIVATSEAYLETTQFILDKLLPKDIEGSSLQGGGTRQESILNALQEALDSDLVIVHDAVRPFVKPSSIQQCCKVAEEVGGAVLGVPAKDTIKRIDDDGIIRETPDRTYLWQAQTPQVFQKEILFKAYIKAKGDNFAGTDDASLVERTHCNVRMVEGERSNFKITYPLDLQLAKLLIEKGHWE